MQNNKFGIVEWTKLVAGLLIIVAIPLFLLILRLR